MQPPTTTLALLPLENLSGIVDDALLAKGFLYDLIAELAQFPSLGVIAADTVFSEVAAQQDDLTFAREIGADHLLKGSLRRWQDTLRINVQLIETSGGHHVWAGRYDGADLQEVHDEIAAKIANALALQVDQSLLKHSVSTSAPPDREAYLCWLRGMECLQRGTAEADAEGRQFFERAITLAPQQARAYGGLSLSYFNDWSCQSWDRWCDNEQRAYELARQAESLNPHDALVQMILARVEQYRREFDRAGPRLDRVRLLAPNDAYILIQLSGAYSLHGHPETAWELAQRALALNPLCSSWYHYFVALSLFLLRRFEEMLAAAAKAPPELVVDLPVFKAIAHSYLGQTQQAASYMEAFRFNFKKRIAGDRPADTAEMRRWLLHVNPFRREEDIALFSEGLRLAGLTDALNETTAPLAWPVANIFRREGAVWMLSFEGQAAQMPELRGLTDIARLLASPGEEHASAQLADLPVQSAGLDILDDQARQSYRQRLIQLDEEIATASTSGRISSAQSFEEEREVLIQELKNAVGLGGRQRKNHDSSERARTTVTWRIRHAIRRIETLHPPLGRHLANSIRTGVFCSYQPERETHWQI